MDSSKYCASPSPAADARLEATLASAVAVAADAAAADTEAPTPDMTLAGDGRESMVECVFICNFIRSSLFRSAGGGAVRRQQAQGRGGGDSARGQDPSLRNETAERQSLSLGSRRRKIYRYL
mmetsp:Transcript_24599/g.71935  ORF Transcript_24599/g.71935 Transcript_24599/m.71935 type:complete len:122 (+) Transcript_24599:805-1170(+)